MTKRPVFAALRCVTALVFAWLGMALGNVPATVLADPPAQPFQSKSPTGEADEEDDSPDAPEQDWLSRLAGATGFHRDISAFAIGHDSVLSAFRDVVAKPAKSTVRILSAGKQVALGSIVDADGFIATKGSELGGPVTCELADGTRYDAHLVGMDYGSDLALLKISAEGLPTIRWSNDEPPTVGGWVVTPGTGELPQAIGIVSVAPHRVRGGVLGVRLTEDEHGPRVTEVVPHSGAAKAGLSSGDIVTHINGNPVKDSEAMVATTSALLPGEKIKMTILRHGQRQEVTAALGSVSDTLLGRRARFQDHLGTSLSTRRYLFPSALEHDSILEPNQCGGSLINLDGETIGINIARANRVSSYAIPASAARPVLESLKNRATVPVSGQADNHKLSAADGG